MSEGRQTRFKALPGGFDERSVPVVRRREIGRAVREDVVAGPPGRGSGAHHDDTRAVVVVHAGTTGGMAL